jgi:hypothetical protein
MPNNASARRDKDKKKKDNKKKDNKRTYTLSLLKEDTDSADSGTLSLSIAGMEQTRSESSLILYERALTRPDLLHSLAGMEVNIQKHAKGEEDSGTEQMKDVLRYEHSQATTVEERLEICRNIRKDNPLASGDEIKSLFRDAMLGAAIEWRRNVLQGEKDFLLAKKKKKKSS